MKQISRSDKRPELLKFELAQLDSGFGRRLTSLCHRAIWPRSF